MRGWCKLWLGSAAALVATGAAPPPPAPDVARAAMVAKIRADADEDYPGLSAEPGFQAAVAAIGRIDRTAFVPPALRARAYDPVPQEIGYGQTISDAYIVAVMTAAVEARAGANVFEVGTGSGYQAAVLAEMGATVRSMEVVVPLATAAAARLQAAGYARAFVRAGDAYAGWPEFAPYDAIIVTAGGAAVPPALLAQLRAGGKLVMPIGLNTFVEQLVLFTKTADGGTTRCSLGPAMFVPLTGHGRQPERAALYDRTIPLCRKGQRARWPGQPGS